MILSLHEQARMFLLCIALGGGMGLLYDCLRVFRHSLHHKRFWVQAEDALFWLTAVFLVFGVLLRANSGEVRFFSRQRDTAYQVSGAPFFSYPFYAVPPAFPPFSETSAEIWRLLRKLAKKTVAKRAGLCENE